VAGDRLHPRIVALAFARMRRGLVLASAMLIVALGLAVFGHVDPAQAARCRSVHAGGEKAHRIHAHNLGCPSTRHHLRRWMRTHFPHDPIGWFCDTHSRPDVCSKGNGGGAPYFTFYLRR
jgi:hypothetical protein